LKRFVITYYAILFDFPGYNRLVKRI